MSIGTYLPNNGNKRVSILWLISAILGVAFIALGIWIHGIITESQYKEKRLYQTALKITDAKQFNYSVETKQGNVLAYGTFTFPDLVKFPEMTKSFAYIKKTKEKYTRHEREVCEDTYDSEGNVTGEECHTEEYHTWDYQTSEELSGKKVKFMNKEYSRSQFHFPWGESINASDIIKGETERCWYPERKKTWLGFEKEGNIRWCYDGMNSSYQGSIFLNTFNGLSDITGSNKIMVSNQTIEERIKGVELGAKLATGFFVFFWILLTIGAIAGSAYLFYEELDWDEYI